MDYDECLANEKIANELPAMGNQSDPTPMPHEENCHPPWSSLPDTYMRKQWAVLWWGTMILSW